MALLKKVAKYVLHYILATFFIRASNSVLILNKMVTNYQFNFYN